MPTHAATALAASTTQTSTGTGYGALILLTLAITLGYAFVCWIWPFIDCRRCQSTGRYPTWIRGTVRLCPRCNGSGYQLRAGRWIYNQLRRSHDRAHH